MSSNKTLQGSKRVLVVGGGGFFGSYLTHTLLSQGHSVRVLDKASFADSYIYKTKFQSEYQSRLEQIKGDILDKELVLKCCQNIDIVFHTASLLRFWSDSFIAPASERLLIEKVNVNGTRNVIDACLAANVPYLIYTSSCNVAIDGVTPVKYGTEQDELPTSYVDVYSKTKSQAEKMVRQSNGVTCHNQQVTLKTAVIRPVGIYGPGEYMHFTRAIQYSKLPILPMIGNPSIMTDWVFVENLVHGHLLLANQLVNHANHVSGQAYYISDGVIINNMTIFEPIIKAAGNACRPLWLPTSIMFYVGFLMELICCLLFFAKRVVNFGLFTMVYLTLVLLVNCLKNKTLESWKEYANQARWQSPSPVYPIFTRIEVYKVGMDNYFSIENAKRDLGYEPVVDWKVAVERTAQFYKELVNSKATVTSNVFKKTQ